MHSRRALLRDAFASAAAALLTPGPARAASGPRFTGYPFTLGVASGYPRPDGVTLWTRLAPSPLDPDGGLPPENLGLAWEVAEDEGFQRPVTRGEVTAFPEHAHSVRVDVRGLAPGRWYHYRFHCGAETSPVGRTRTAEPPGAAVARLRFAIGSCQHYEQGWYSAHRHLLAENLDLMVFLGDYIYESTWGADLVRRYAGDEPVTLGDYRVRHAQHKADVDLQRLHGAVPWAVTWDDHEVDNDWAGEVSEHADPAFLTRRAAAFQAYLEHLPLPAGVRLVRGGVRLHTTLAFGDLARFYVLDDRQYRTPQACPSGKGGGSTMVRPRDCPELVAPNRTLLGVEQETWLDQAFAGSRQAWNVVAQQTMFTSGSEGKGEDREVWTDGWDGYPRSRALLLSQLQKRKVANPLFVGGDIHATVLADVHTNPADPASPRIASEVCGTSITSQGGSPEDAEALMAAEPHVRYANTHQRGYNLIVLTPTGASVTTRAVREKERDSGVETVASFRIEAGRPGLVKA